MGLLSFLFGNKTAKIKEMLEKGALIIDVRSKHEFAQGNAKGSINIPLDRLDSQIKKLRSKGKPIVACCASGMRSGVAAKKLNEKGLDAMNGGSWTNVSIALKD